MNWNEYLNEFETILNSDNPPAPYDNAEYWNYTKLNNARLNRWLKTAVLSENTKEIVHSVQQNQKWILITEPWCGDAAHIAPIIYMMSALNPKIELIVQLRDTDSEIDKYLTNGGKSIPILVVRDAVGKDLFHWGPRPSNAQELFSELKQDNASFEEIKEALQYFYNKDKTESIQKEITALLKIY